MGLYNFQPQFKPYILDGSKQHTIRRKRRLADIPGHTCHLYSGLRQKDAELLGRAPCVKVEEIDLGIHADAPEVWVAGNPLTAAEAEALAWRDGFRGASSPSLTQMFDFFAGKLPFTGDLIHWDWRQRQALQEKNPIRHWGLFPTDTYPDGYWHFVIDSKRTGFCTVQCGRHFPAPPIRSQEHKPDLLRGVCRACEKFAGRQFPLQQR